MRMLSEKPWTGRLWLATGIFVLALSLLSLSTQLLWAQASLQGRWATLPYTMPINPIHRALLHNGKVLIVAGFGNVAAGTNFRAAVWDPQAGAVGTQPVPWGVFCHGLGGVAGGRALHTGRARP